MCSSNQAISPRPRSFLSSTLPYYFYCPILSTLIYSQWWQAVTRFVMVEASFFVSEQATCFVVGDFAWCVALVGCSQEHRHAIANLRYGDGRRRFFFRGAIHTPKTKWR